MISFICPTCGQFDIESPDCSSCSSPTAETGAIEHPAAAVD